MSDDRRAVADDGPGDVDGNGDVDVDVDVDAAEDVDGDVDAAVEVAWRARTTVPRPGGVEELIVPAVFDGDRIDRVVALLLDVPRAVAQDLVASVVLVDGRPAAKSRRLRAGERLSVPPAPTRTEQRPLPQPIEIPVRHVDEDVIVVAKPVDLVVHPAGGHPDGTLVNGLLHLFPEIADVGDPARPGIVHRLDRDTSGLMVVARSARAYDSLVEALSRRSIVRGYLALVAGRFDTPRGVVDAPIGRSPRNRERMAVVRGGREARTGFEVARGARSVVARRMPARDRPDASDPRAPPGGRAPRRR